MEKCVEDKMFYCPSCNAGYLYTDELAEKKVQCGECEHKFIVQPLTETQLTQDIQNSPLAQAQAPENSIADKPAEIVPTGKKKRAIDYSRYKAGRQPAGSKKKIPKRKKASRLAPLLVFSALFATASLIGFFVWKNQNRGGNQAVTIVAKDDGSISGKASFSSSIPKSHSAPAPASTLSVAQPAAPSGPYSGFDLEGIESIVKEVENSKVTWRVEADRRIDKYRKANISIYVVNAATGEPEKDAVVTVRLLKHKFRFGGIISSPVYRKRQNKYKEVFLNMGFTSAGFCNALKAKLWGGAKKREVWEIIDWLHSEGISVRGHCLIWPGGYHMPAELTKLVTTYSKSPSEQLKTQIREVSNGIVKTGAERWDVMEWDVINETRGNHDIQDIVGKQIEAEWFGTAQKYAKNRNINLCLNDNTIISDPPRRTRIISPKTGKPAVIWQTKIKSSHVMGFHKSVERLLQDDAPISGLGFQSRFGAALSPEIIYDRLCVFDDFNIPIVATEFEIKLTIGDEPARAALTEQVMTLYFSHRLVDGIYAWSLFPSTSKREILNESGLPNRIGKVWLYLMKNRWNTHETVAADASGRAVIRGFKGKYQITIKSGGREKKIVKDIFKDKEITIEI